MYLREIIYIVNIYIMLLPQRDYFTVNIYVMLPQRDFFTVNIYVMPPQRDYVHC